MSTLESDYALLQKLRDQYISKREDVMEKPNKSIPKSKKHYDRWVQ